MNRKTDLYKILELEKNVQIHDGKRLIEKVLILRLIHNMNIYSNLVKANYYRLARVCHPDRVDETQKAEASEKFVALHLAYSILADPEKKKAYDAGDSSVLFTKTTVAGKWEQYIQPVEVVDSERAKSKYQGSDTEQNDVMREIVNGNGSMTHLFNTIPFMRFEDEPRMIEMVKEFINMGKISKISIRKMPNSK